MIGSEFYRRLGNEKVHGYIKLSAALILFISLLAGEIMVIDGGRGIAYLFHPEKDVALLKEQRQEPWIVYGPTVGVYSYYDWILPERICFLTAERSSEDEAAVLALDGDNFVLYVYEDYLPDALDFFRKVLERPLEATYLTKSTNLTVYLVE